MTNILIGAFAWMTITWIVGILTGDNQKVAFTGCGIWFVLVRIISFIVNAFKKN